MPDNKFTYVSYTEPDVRTTIEGLIEANQSWEPLKARIIPEFDYPGFIERYGFKGALLEPGTGSDDAARTVAERVLAVLNDESHRRGPESHTHAEGSEIPRLVEEAVGRRSPVRIVIPSFPGRPHNPWSHRRVRPDLSEAYALLRLKNVSDHVRTVYPPGVEFIILLDGRAYSPFYGSSPEADEPYVEELRTLVGKLDAEESIGLLDLQDLVDERAAEFEEVKRLVAPEVEAEWNKPDYEFRDQLIAAMRLGTDTTALNAAAIQLVKHETDTGIDTNTLIKRMREGVDERGRRTAFDYMVFLVTIKRMELIKTRLPDAIRGTVHPKPGQYSPYLTDPETAIAPWHGVPIVFGDGRIRTVYESYVYQNHSAFRAVYEKGDYEPFYYEEA
ncbi:L-tyrosine/L-tryptophan isonitrile synthase family protein [Nocardiopsis sp. NPDC101807]|uniref:L-tyrosine/L-tryptophan isonitrile synthase family protein n=1 Tax=Nocardiopsis sp. NPDC101807 TaxID=3364339 RepID=UPI00380DEABB